MNSIFRRLAILLVLFCLASSTAALAADCDALKTQIRQQRNLLKKRALLDAALESCGHDAEVHYLRAYAAERLRKYDKALAAYLKATETDSRYAKAYFGMGDIYMVLGNAESAIRAYTTGLDLEPGDKRAQASLDLARIKDKAASGSGITSQEFVRVMEQSKQQGTTEGALDGPLLRMQIRFYVNSSRLTAEAREQLEVVGEALESVNLKDKKFEISGHTDATGAPEANLKLSRERAEQVRSHLIRNFEIKPDTLVVSYYGDTRPAAPNDSPQNRSRNRRVEFKRLKQ